MNFVQEELNMELGNKLRMARIYKKWSYVTLQEKINRYYLTKHEKRLKSNGITNEEIELFFSIKFVKLDVSLQKKLKHIGIKNSYYPISVSTIASYENGKSKIPAWYLILMKELLGNIEDK